MEQSVSGALPLGEPQKIRAMLSRRVFGWRRYVPLMSTVVLTLSILAGIEILAKVDAPPLVTFVVALSVFISGIWVIQWFSRRINVQAMRRRGSAASHQITYSLLPEGLKTKHERGESLCYWSAIDEIARTRNHWTFMTLGMGYVLPRRFFAEPAGEQRFMQAVWDRLTPEAKQRSMAVAGFFEAKPG